MEFDEHMTQPLAILRWEHKKLEKELEKLSLMVSHDARKDAERFSDKLNLTLQLLESHQEAEERFLFPLVQNIDTGLLSDLKKEHISIFSKSDIITASTSLNDLDNLRNLLLNLKSILSNHFATEESLVFPEAERSLSSAQMDVLRIKFATRRIIIVKNS
jgi:hemerythrin-like domain-containing protein